MNDVGFLIKNLNFTSVFKKISKRQKLQVKRPIFNN
jgi:hypothetical protein